MRKQARSKQTPLLIGLALGLFASACSEGPQTNDEASPSPTTSQATTSTIEQTTTSDVPAAETDMNESDDGDSRSYGTGDAPLLLALDTLSEAKAFRMTVTIAQNIQSSGLGLNVSQHIDPDRPATTTETAANGDTYIYLDLGPLLSPMAAGDRRLIEVFDETHIEMWTTPDQMVIDATGYQGLADLDPTTDLGPFAPGVGYIDLAQLEDLAGADLVKAIVGNSLTDPVALAQQLPLALENIEPDPENPNVYTATSNYAAIIEAQGQDIVALSRGIAIPIAPTIGVSVDELAAFYQRMYEQMLTELVITIGNDGSIASIRDTTDISDISDISDIFDLIVSEESGLALPITEKERDQFRALFADTVWVMTTVTTFELDDSIVVTPPTGELENRTQLARDYFAELVG